MSKNCEKRKLEFAIEVAFDSDYIDGEPPAKRQRHTSNNLNANKTKLPTNDVSSLPNENEISIYRIQANENKLVSLIYGYFEKSGFLDYNIKCDNFIDIVAKYLSINYVAFGDSMQTINIFGKRKKAVSTIDIINETCFVAATQDVSIMKPRGSLSKLKKPKRQRKYLWLSIKYMHVLCLV